jgi:flagellar basal body-associated protein FliL
MNIKYIKIIIIILIILAIVFGFIIINNNNNKKNVTNNNTETSISNNGNSRETLKTNTNTKNNEEFINNYYTISTSTQNTNNEKIDDVVSLEKTKLQNIEKNLFNWELTKDVAFLKEALKLTEDSDNEAFVDKWSIFMSKNSSELIKMVDSSTDIKKNSMTAYLIFDWYINLNVEYKKLSNTKRQEINRQYQQLKTFLNIK